MRLLTVQEVWEVLGRGKVGRTTVYNIVRRHGFRLGRRYVVPEVVLERLLRGELNMANHKGDKDD